MINPRKFPVLVNGTKVVGWLVLDERVSDEEVIKSQVSWGYTGSAEDMVLREMTLIPELRVAGEANINGTPPTGQATD